MGITASTLIYLFMFILTVSTAALADKCFKRKSKVLGIALLVFVILIPSVLAGVRGNDVGRDVQVYGLRVFNIAKQYASFWPFQNQLNGTIGYMVLAFGVSRIFPDAGWLLFFLQLLVMAPITMVAYKVREKTPISLTVCVYLFLFYNNSLNIMKQSISCAFLLLMFLYLREFKLVRSVALGVFAILFHPSAIIGVAVIITVLLAERTRAAWTEFMIIAVLLIAVMNLQTISSLMLDKGILAEKFVSNITEFFGSSQSYLKFDSFKPQLLYDLVFRGIFCFLPILLLYYTHREQDRAVNLIVVIGFVVYFYTFFKYTTVYGGRVTLYCDFFWILLVPKICEAVKIRLKSGFDITFVGMWLFLFADWFPWVMIFGWSASNHFAFRF